MKIHCNIAKDLMPLYMDDVLSEESKAAVEEHLTECEDCRVYFREMQKTDLSETNADIEEILGRLDEAERIRRLRRSMLIKRIVTIVVTVAAAVLVFIAGNILIFHNESYIAYEDTGIRVEKDGYMYVEKPYYGYTGVYSGEDSEGNQIEIFFLTSSLYSRNWEKAPKPNEQLVCSLRESDDAPDKVYYLPEKYVRENRLDGFFATGRTLFDSIPGKNGSMNDEELQKEMDKLITEIENEAPLVWPLVCENK